MNCNIFRVQFANNFHIFLHICHGLPGKAGDKVHVDDGKTQFPAVLIHGVNIFDPVAPAQGIEEMLLQRLGIDADAIDTGLAEHGQHVRRRRIGPSRFDGPFAGFREIPGQPRHHRFQYRQGQARRRTAADVDRISPFPGIGRGRDVPAQGFDIALAVSLQAGIGRKVAVQAFMAAERDVDVQAQRHSSSTLRTAMKASCGISTVPNCFMRFLPSFCFSRSLRLREISPP